MSVLIDDTDAGAWAKSPEVDFELNGVAERAYQAQTLSNVVRAQLSVKFDTSSWDSPSSTPMMVRSAIAMAYIAWVYNKQFAGQDDSEAVSYADLLRAMSKDIVAGLLNGTMVLLEPEATVALSGGTLPVVEELTDPVFTMGRVF
jgi:hypothetical protein